jgi:SnoaL-like domain
MTNADNYSPQRLADRTQIQDVLYRWGRAVDRLDYEGMRAVFHPGATDTHGAYVGDIHGLIEWIRQRHITICFSMHALFNILIEFAGPDLALVESTASTIQAHTGVPGHVVIFSRNVDRFERRDGEWRIQERVVVFDSRTTFEQPQSPLTWPPGFVVGQRNRTDPLYQAREKLGLR